ncbi:CREB/ATF bZIP transcription factor [Myotis davidii]|uniref:CREB/ATF bZIP transcription factor n=1 Tax=Myotis davidii TaxID=225400 RepID=L5MCM3_MYODS|nr:CREB/ATF bZIP transcription factor [Myotis davidii]
MRHSLTTLLAASGTDSPARSESPVQAAPAPRPDRVTAAAEEEPATSRSPCREQPWRQRRARDAPAGDHDYALPVGKQPPQDLLEEDDAAGGVCLHVDKDKVSVEFCSACARKASSSLKM